jgi:UDP-2,3-diacylglucosamine pyrophosphatase LpxH
MSPTRQCFVTSDLHLGNGIAGDPLEDFWQDEAFAAWVADLGEGTTLVLNGDVIECAQLEPLDVTGVPNFLLWDSAASVAKVTAAIAGHPAFFDALAGLLSRGGELVFVIGNHDLDLDFPAVQALLRDRIEQTDSHPITFLTGDFFYEGVRIAHGHEFAPENCPRDIRSFRHEYDDGSGPRELLERVWGTDLVLHLFNRIEARYPFADNVKPSRSILWHGLRQGWIGGADLVRLVAFVATRELDVRAMIGALLSSSRPAAAGAGAAVGQVAAKVAEPEWSTLLLDLSSDPAFVAEVEDALAALDPTSALALGGAPVQLGDVALSGQGVSEEPVLGGFGRREKQAAKRALKKKGTDYVVFGHTHHVVDGELGGKSFNPGTWIPRLNLDDPAVADHVDDVGITEEVLSDPALYNFKLRAVHIQPGADPMVRLVTISHDPKVPVVGVGRTQP